MKSKKEKYLSLVAQHIDARGTIFHICYFIAQAEALLTAADHGEIEMEKAQQELMLIANFFEKNSLENAGLLADHVKNLVLLIKKLDKTMYE